MGTEIQFEVQLLNLHYTLKGFDAIKALKEWLDENASEGWEQPSLGEPDTPPVTTR